MKTLVVQPALILMAFAFADGVPNPNTLADIAMFYYENDLQTTLIDDVPVTGTDIALVIPLHPCYKRVINCHNT